MGSRLDLTVAEARRVCAAAEADLRHGRPGDAALAGELEASLPESVRDLLNILVDTMFREALPAGANAWAGGRGVVLEGAVAERAARYLEAPRG